MARPKTLLFCTSFAVCYDLWLRRYQRWLEGVRQGGLEYDQVLLVDDCSPTAPAWPGLVVVPADGRIVPYKSLVMARFQTHLGQRGGRNHATAPGWFRSFGYAIEYARAGNFSKIVHIESDTHVLSRRLEVFINERSTGWTALWCPRHGFPEDNVQVIVGLQIDASLAFFRRPYSHYAVAPIEQQYPFTAVEANFVGDRYGEYRSDVPKDADFVAQAREYPTNAERYYWWLSEQPAPQRAVHHLALPVGVEDVTCGYNLFLFRDPESREAIRPKVGMTIGSLIATFITSLEFREYVLPSILNGRGLVYRGQQPIQMLKRWLLRALPWDNPARAAILESTTTTSLVLETLRNPGVVPRFVSPASSD